VVFAQANLRTIVVDADLRHPSLHEVFEMKNEKGLGDLLESPEMHVEDCLQPTGINNLQILTSGKGLVDPSERLGSERMNEIMARLNKSADIVIFDCPPALIFADALDLGRRMDGVIVVLRAGKSKRDVVNQVLFDLRNARANVLGTILNDSPRNPFGSSAAYEDRSPFRIAGALRTRPQVGQAVLPAAQEAVMEEVEGSVPDGEADAGQMLPDLNAGRRSNHRRRH
jgi:non-specific protein-tyrosine kinase